LGLAAAGSVGVAALERSVHKFVMGVVSGIGRVAINPGH
jgi:hypothetical protein